MNKRSEADVKDTWKLEDMVAEDSLWEQMFEEASGEAESQNNRNLEKHHAQYRKDNGNPGNGRGLKVSAAASVWAVEAACLFVHPAMIPAAMAIAVMDKTKPLFFIFSSPFTLK